MTYIIDSKDSEKDWAGEVGRINKELIKRVVPFTPKDKDVLIYVCGPPAFMKAISGDKAKVVQLTDIRTTSHTCSLATTDTDRFSLLPSVVLFQDYSQGEVDGALKELGFSKDQVYKF